MLSRQEAVEVIDRLHNAQTRLYDDGDPEAVRGVLTDDIAWHVPGASPIAGSYHGIDEVVAYMLARRELADGTFRMHRLDVLTGSGQTVAVLTDGEVSVGGRLRRWSTVGVYRVRDGRVAECRLVPFDQAEFDEIWAARGPV